MPWVRYTFGNVCNRLQNENTLMKAFKGSIIQPSMVSLWKRSNTVVSSGKDLLFQIFFCKNTQTGTARARLAVFVHRWSLSSSVFCPRTSKRWSLSSSLFCPPTRNRWSLSSSLFCPPTSKRDTWSRGESEPLETWENIAGQTFFNTLRALSKLGLSAV